MSKSSGQILRKVSWIVLFIFLIKCPILLQVVRYLKDNLSEKNVLLVLQHICLYCSSASTRTASSEWLDEAPPITVGPKKGRSLSLYETDNDPTPSAPPLPTITENEENEEGHPLLEAEDYMLLETDEREFEAGMAVSSSLGRKVNCCDDLLKECLDLIDKQASYVLASEDIEDLDISALNMIVCRDTLRLRKGEVEVFQALKRWSTRECKRQRMELTSDNRRKVLEGAQYLVRYLTMGLEDYKSGPYKSGLLTAEESEAVFNAVIIGANNSEASASTTTDLPDHLLHWQHIWKKPRKIYEAIASSTSRKGGGSISAGGGPWSPFTRSMSSIGYAREHRDSIASGLPSRSRAASRTGLISSGASVKSRSDSLANPLDIKFDEQATNQRYNSKEKFNFIEEFFICLACIFD